jgi:ATP-dependent DNA ligase
VGYHCGVDLPVVPPTEPMLARLARSLPAGDYLYEPKWDGFRCLVCRSGGNVDMRSRHNRPMTRYFPELEAALLAISDEAFVLDGEILLLTGEATLPPSWGACILRRAGWTSLHAGRLPRL